MLFGTLSAARAPLLRQAVFMDVCRVFDAFFAPFGVRGEKAVGVYSHSIVLGGFELMS
jgi:hypothetical protein